MTRLSALLLSGAALVLTACGDEQPPICKAIDANRAAYKAAEKQENEIARDAALKRAVAEGRQRLADATKDGEIKGWKAEVKSVSSSLKGLAVVKLTLPCKGTLIADGAAPDSPLYSQVTALKEGKLATFDGSFVKALDGSAPYKEISVTGWGEMTDPEFIVRLTSIKQ